MPELPTKIYTCQKKKMTLKCFKILPHFTTQTRKSGRQDYFSKVTYTNSQQQQQSVLVKEEKCAIEKGYIEELCRAFQDMIDNNFAEVVDEEVEPEDIHYLPAHPVIRADHLTTKVRVLFNASARTNNGYSRNWCLYQVPCLLPDIIHVIIRCRMNLFVFVLDISKMFL
jgi:hypothetical protein